MLLPLSTNLELVAAQISEMTASGGGIPHDEARDLARFCRTLAREARRLEQPAPVVALDPTQPPLPLEMAAC